MNRKALWTVVGCVLALALVALVPYVRADEVNQASQLTFSQPVELPGNHVLPAGTYWFLVPENVSGGNVVQIFNADRTQLLETLETVPMDRPDVTTETQLTFGRLYNHPVALMSWFYPGDLIGHQFIYTPQQESQFSEGSQFTVMARSGSAVSVG